MSPEPKPNVVLAETAREFLVAALGEAHREHTVVRVDHGAKAIGFRCSCKISHEYWNEEPMGKRAHVALRNVPKE